MDRRTWKAKRFRISLREMFPQLRMPSITLAIVAPKQDLPSRSGVAADFAAMFIRDCDIGQMFATLLKNRPSALRTGVPRKHG